MDPQSPTVARSGVVARSEMIASCAISMRGQNANRCASFVSADTGLHGLFRPKQLIWLKPVAERKLRFMLILKGFFERKAGAARQD
jgi:hypothetical protein